MGTLQVGAVTDARELSDARLHICAVKHTSGHERFIALNPHAVDFRHNLRVIRQLSNSEHKVVTIGEIWPIRVVVSLLEVGPTNGRQVLE